MYKKITLQDLQNSRKLFILSIIFLILSIGLLYFSKQLSVVFLIAAILSIVVFSLRLPQNPKKTKTIIGSSDRRLEYSKNLKYTLNSRKYLGNSLGNYIVIDFLFNTYNNHSRVCEVHIGRFSNTELIDEYHTPINDQKQDLTTFLLKGEFDYFLNISNAPTIFEVWQRVEEITDNFKLPILAYDPTPIMNQIVAVLLSKNIYSPIPQFKFINLSELQLEKIDVSDNAWSKRWHKSKGKERVDVLDHFREGFLRINTLFIDSQKKQQYINEDSNFVVDQNDNSINGDYCEVLKEEVVFAPQNKFLLLSNFSRFKNRFRVKRKFKRKKIRINSLDKSRLIFPDDDPFITGEPTQAGNSTSVVFNSLTSTEKRDRLIHKLKGCDSGFDFENFVADLFRNLGYTDVVVTKGSGDFGADVTGFIGGKKVAIQCKFYTGSVGIAAVQEVLSGLHYYNANTGIVVTNSYFTPAAIEMAQKANIKLVDGKELDSMINNVK